MNLWLDCVLQGILASQSMRYEYMQSYIQSFCMNFMGNLVIVTTIRVAESPYFIMGYKTQHANMCDRNKGDTLREKKSFSLCKPWTIS